jgi:hypothetical protein
MECLVALQALLAQRDGYLTASQMVERHGGTGLPFIWHFGMWGDFIIVSPLIGVIVGTCSPQWRVTGVIVAAGIGLVGSLLMGCVYALGTIPQVHVHEHQTTVAGWIHLLYTAVTLSILCLFYLGTPRLPMTILVVATALLTIQLFVGTHMVLGLLKSAGRVPWYPDQPLKSVVGWTILLVGSLILWSRTIAVFAFR